MARFPWDPVAATGRAEVLKVAGRLDEALDAYDRVLLTHPENLYARHGTASTLKLMNRLSDAVSVYEEITTQYPHDADGQIRRVGLNLALGNENLADLEALEIDAARTDAEWSAVAISGLVQLKRYGAGAAEAVFSRGIVSAPREEQRSLFSLCSALAHLQTADYQGAFDRAQRVTVATSRPSAILRMHALAGMNDEEGLDTLKSQEASQLAPVEAPIYGLLTEVFTDGDGVTEADTIHQLHEREAAMLLMAA